MDLTDVDNMMKFVMSYNVNEIVKFHTEIRSYLKEKYQENNNNNPVQSKYENFDRYLSTNTFLMVYSGLEESLSHIQRRYVVDVEVVSGISSIVRFKPVLKSLGYELGGKSWVLITDAEKIRNCLLHANGNLSLTKKNGNEIENIKKKYAEDLFLKNGKLYVDVGFLSKFVEEVKYIQGFCVEQGRG